MTLLSSELFCIAAALFIITICAGCEASHDGSVQSSKQNLASKSEADTVRVDYVGYMTVEELFYRFMNNRIYGNEVASYADAVLKTKIPGAADSVLAYSKQYNSSTALDRVAHVERAELGPWLQANSSGLALKYWSELGRTLAHSSWRDSVVVEVLMEKVLTTDSQNIRCAAARAFVGVGTLEEVRTLAAIGDTTSSACVAHFATSAQARFDVPKFNRHVRETLLDTSRLHTRILEGVEENHRHDFLSDLRTLREQLARNDPKRYLVYVTDLIAELEADKAKEITPGAPLDYPNTTRADSTST